MSSKLPWVRNFYQEWIMDFAGTDAAEKATYSTLTALIYRACEPIYDDTSVLARVVGCSVHTFKKSLEKLIRKKLILQLENGNLWSTQVEEELKNCNENLNRLSERAVKAANTKRNKKKDNSSREHDEVMTTSSQCHDDIMMSSSRQHININNNIYKKTNTIVLAKKEIGSEDLETNDLIEEPIEVHDLESQSEPIETASQDQSPLHEQESIPKKAKQAKANRGCRLPEDFEPDYDFAIAEGLPSERVKVEIAKFRDYWRSKSGANATKIDWQATWRNWVRKAIEDLEKTKNTNNNGGNSGGSNGNFSKDQRTCGGTGETIRNLIRKAGFSESTSRHCTTDGAIRHKGVSIDLNRWREIDTSSRGTSFCNLSNSPKLTYLESVC
ncbi:DUF1376 domain-containing protein [Bartonella henselae]|uniref:DUF1376 domain-containing protein n=4 Tax=Bartonella henselae TaxID=38323 RepID=UPI0003DF84D6|nr:DUF1376 domain-containing protein [Bartonella henselae]ETS11156.1 hypothetical protein Q653_00070 [Bartonella henselae JK 42]ETS12005.1 hypothetical protein Q652_01344 [Bartonella henselae JK 41]KEC54459.1 hypothetical protein O97_01616 [Bartonella henselae str. Zeus]KEC57549.1 hypothetical protein O95_01605 [Bartonella henselae JK 53]MDM9985595.1 DUF1376 domain-containing protein [Bartonella henselae]